LSVIETTSRNALAEIRRTFGVLRADTAYAPTPGLADLPELAAWAVSAGTRLELTVTPAHAVLPEGIGLAVYRIVQEAVTNVVKHAGPASCQATVVVEAGRVLLEVSDDGSRVHAPAGYGQGIIGMRERTALYSGDFSAGPRPGGGFAVTACFPLDAP
jgi:signal transduction histidine kinase